MKKNLKKLSGFGSRREKSIFQYVLFLFLAMHIIISGCKNEVLVNSSDVILLVNSNSTLKSVAIEKVVPYLNHFGVKFKTVDIAKEEIPSETTNSALIIIGHSEITTNNGNGLATQLEDYLERCQSEGTGILSFDPLMPKSLLTQPNEESERDTNVGELLFSDENHYITEYRQAGEKQNLFGYMSIPKLSTKAGQVLLTGNDLPLLVVNNQQKGKVAQWTSTDWMYYSILGPLGGLDDCLWKSIVWAARKPFVMQSIPPIATMRVDDVMGTGRQQWDVSPFQWVKIANKYGFKPWLGLFNYNITPEGVEELKELLSAGWATATPHAFGRPPRKESEIETIVNIYNPYYAPQMAATHFVPDYWHPNAIPYLSEYYDEFIFFDHNNQKPWPDETAQKILEAVDNWYHDTGLPMGKYLVPHWGEISSNMITHVYDKWNIEFTSIRETDKSWGQQIPEYRLREGEKPVRSAPFRLYDEPVIGKSKKGITTSRASYNVDFKEFESYKFFDFSSTINDITGYEWMPDNNVEATAERGIKTLGRGLEAKALAVLFTHETDYIYNIEPDNWDKIFKKVSEGISRYNPVLLTTDDALTMLRAFNTSEIQSSNFNKKTGELTVKMTGETDIETNVFVYTEKNGGIIENLVYIPVFKDEVSKVWKNN